LVTALPAGEKWTYEIKFDGYRCVTVKRGGEVTYFRPYCLHVPCRLIPKAARPRSIPDQ
jgi:hypothetical protein